MSFIYPRTINIYRQTGFPRGTAGLGAQPYQEPQTVNAASVWSTRPVASNITCSIQEYRSGQRPVENLPGSTLVTPTSKIFVPLRSLARGAVSVRDYIMDDLGLKYEVINPYWNSLGYRIYCVYLEN